MKLSFISNKNNKNNKNNSAIKHRLWHKKLGNFIFFIILFFVFLIGLGLFLTDTPVGFKYLLRLSRPVLNHYQIQISGPTHGVLTNFSIDQLSVAGQTLTHFHSAINLEELSFGKIIFTKISLDIPFSTEPQALILPIQISGEFNIFSPYQFSLQGHGLIKQLNLSTHLEVNLNIAGNLTHYQVSAVAEGEFKNDAINLILQGFGSSDYFKTEEFNLKIRPYNNLSETPIILNFNLDLNFNTSPVLSNPNNLNNINNPNLNHSEQKKSDLIKSNPLTQKLEIYLHYQNASGHWVLSYISSENKLNASALTLNTPSGLWQTHPISILIQPEQIHIPEICLTQSQNNSQNNSQNKPISTNQACFDLAIFFQPHSQTHSNSKKISKAVSTQTKIKAQVKLDIYNIQIFQPLLPNLNNLSGKLSGALSITGPLSHLVYQGEINLTHGSAGVPEWGVMVNPIFLKLEAHQENLIHLTGQATAGQGKALLNGSIGYDAKTQSTSILFTLSGHQLTFVNLPMAHIEASPNLTYTQNAKLQVLNGVINIDQAMINADEYKNLPLRESSDIIFVDQQGNPIQTDKSLPFAMDLTLNTGEHTFFSGFGVQTQVKGQIKISSKANQPTFADGELTLTQGRYAAYGKHFEIQKGALIFNHSPITNPNIDVRAIYNLNAVSMGNMGINNILIGVKVSGTLEQIHLSLFSNPPMSQENIFSYIITGAPLSQAGPGSQTAITQAALSFSSGGGDESVLDKVQETLQLNQLSVGSLNAMPNNNLSSARASSNPDQNNTAVFVGKALTSRFFISYGVGLFNNQQIFLTHFKISQHFYLQTDTSTMDSGADIFYTFEH